MCGWSSRTTAPKFTRSSTVLFLNSPTAVSYAASNRKTPPAYAGGVCSIVFIRRPSLSCVGWIHTPHLPALAAGAVRIKKYHAARNPNPKARERAVRLQLGRTFRLKPSGNRNSVRLRLRLPRPCEETESRRQRQGGNSAVMCPCCLRFCILCEYPEKRPE